MKRRTVFLLLLLILPMLMLPVSANADPVIGTEQKRTGKQAVMPPPWPSLMPLQYRQHPRLRVFIEYN